jgi:DNA-binding protein YbaB
MAPPNDVEYLEEALARSEEVMRGLRTAQAALLRVAGRAESADGLVAAVADGRGGITELRLDPRALRLGEAALGRQVTQVLQAAQQEAGRHAQEIMTRALGESADLPEPPDETFVRDQVEQAARDLG